MKITHCIVWGFALAMFALACSGNADPAAAPGLVVAPPPVTTPTTPDRPPAPGAGLASLTISGATLLPSFATSILHYRAAVEVMSKSPFTITPTAENGAATVTVNGAIVPSGQPSKPIRITAAFNAIDVAVKPPSGLATHYLIMAAAAQDAYVKASNTRLEGRFGQDVSLSGDLLAVGSWGDSSNATGVDGNDADTSATRAGAVYIYRRADGVWQQEAYIKASNTRAEAYFGITVALSGDTLAVGAFHDSSGATGVNGDQGDTSAPGAGAAYIFRRKVIPSDSGTSFDTVTWEQEAYLKASNTRADAEFGTAVAIDGDRVIVGSSGESSNATGVDGDGGDTSAPSAGAAYVFHRSNDATSSVLWSQEVYLKASNTRADALFGNSVAVEGDTVAVGSLHESSISIGVNGNQADTSAPGTGAAYVFTRGAAWSQQAYMKSSNTKLSSDVTGGFSIGISLSGDTLAVGCYVEASSATGPNGNMGDTSALNSGAVYVYKRTGITWAHEAYLKPPNTRSLALFGYSVAIAGDTLVVGSINESSKATGIDGNAGDTTMPNAGGAYVFKRVAGTWTHEAYIKASNTRADAAFGYSVALTADRIAIGSTLESSAATGIDGNQADTSAPRAGAVYIVR